MKIDKIRDLAALHPIENVSGSSSCHETEAGSFQSPARDGHPYQQPGYDHGGRKHKDLRSTPEYLREKSEADTLIVAQDDIEEPGDDDHPRGLHDNVGDNRFSELVE